MLGFGFCFFAMIEMPNDMNGLLKSITRSRSDVIVIGAMAKSASCTNGTYDKGMNSMNLMANSVLHNHENYDENREQ